MKEMGESFENVLNSEYEVNLLNLIDDLTSTSSSKSYSFMGKKFRELILFLKFEFSVWFWIFVICYHVLTHEKKIWSLSFITWKLICNLNWSWSLIPNLSENLFYITFGIMLLFLLALMKFFQDSQSSCSIFQITFDSFPTIKRTTLIQLY